MGAGGLNGRRRNHSDHVEPVFRYNLNVDGRGAPSNYFEQASARSSSERSERQQVSSRGINVEGEETMACKRCSNRLSFFNKKNHCQSCRDTFCTSCFELGGKRNERSSWCFSCRALQHPAGHREFLIELKVKELQAYLRARNISTLHCKEKKELVELVLFHAEGRSAAQNTAMPARQSTAQSTAQSTTQPQQHQRSSVRREPREPSRVGSTAPRVPSENPNPPQKTFKPVRTLSVLKSIDEVSSLSVKELKSILTTNYVDFKGCCEKVELLERVRTLWKSKHASGTSDQEGRDSSDRELCKICMDAYIDCVLLECGHMVTCIACGKQLTECPICRQYISRIVHVFKS